MILSAVPAGARSALDVGCGEGMLARALRQRVPEVTGVDLDSNSLALAREQGDDVRYVEGDVLTEPLPSFDFIASVATLHHMDATEGLTRFRNLLNPGGTLVVVGVARISSIRDCPPELAGFVAHRVHKARKDFWQHPSPVVWPPPVTYTQMRRLARSLLPGVHYRRHVLWRYSLLWKKPSERTVRADKS
nr:class I SAM-dependent methyltransferase [Actinocrispum wychmicini]